jgi:hypothetical protein
VLTDIDAKATLKAKLNIERGPAAYSAHATHRSHTAPRSRPGPDIGL